MKGGGLDWMVSSRRGSKGYRISLQGVDDILYVRAKKFKEIRALLLLQFQPLADPPLLCAAAMLSQPIRLRRLQPGSDDPTKRISQEIIHWSRCACGTAMVRNCKHLFKVTDKFVHLGLQLFHTFTRSGWHTFHYCISFLRNKNLEIHIFLAEFFSFIAMPWNLAGVSEPISKHSSRC